MVEKYASPGKSTINERSFRLFEIIFVAKLCGLLLHKKIGAVSKSFFKFPIECISLFLELFFAKIAAVSD